MRLQSLSRGYPHSHACLVHEYTIGQTIFIISQFYSIGLEFIYAQSPESMKGLLTGLFYCVFGIFSGVAVLVFYKFPKSTLNGTSTILWFYVIFTVIGSLGFVGYAVVAFMYVNRVRPAGGPEEEIQGELERGLYT